jgi:hypothetical protein
MASLERLALLIERIKLPAHPRSLYDVFCSQHTPAVEGTEPWLSGYIFPNNWSARDVQPSAVVVKEPRREGVLGLRAPEVGEGFLFVIVIVLFLFHILFR